MIILGWRLGVPPFKETPISPEWYYYQHQLPSFWSAKVAVRFLLPKPTCSGLHLSFRGAVGDYPMPQHFPTFDECAAIIVMLVPNLQVDPWVCWNNRNFGGTLSGNNLECFASSTWLDISPYSSQRLPWNTNESHDDINTQASQQPLPHQPFDGKVEKPLKSQVEWGHSRWYGMECSCHTGIESEWNTIMTYELSNQLLVSCM